MFSPSHFQGARYVLTKRFYNNVDCFTKIIMDRWFQANWVAKLRLALYYFAQWEKKN